MVVVRENDGDGGGSEGRRVVAVDENTGVKIGSLFFCKYII